MAISRRRIPVLTQLLLLALIALAAYVGLGHWLRSNPANIHGSYAIDVLDDKVLVGFASDVFVGRVVDQVGSEGMTGSGPGNEQLPQTQFSVEVLQTIEGNLSGLVTVNQLGGYDKVLLGGGELHLMEGDPLLNPGETVLFVTKHDPENGWYSIIANGFGDIRIRDAQHQAALVERFRQAHEKQIPFTPGQAP